MKFSTRTRYGLRFLIYLVHNSNAETLVQLGQLARKEGISPGYLEQIVRALRPLGIVRAVRGAAGGYALDCNPAEVTLEQLFTYLEGEISPVRCVTPGGECSKSSTCSTYNFWTALDEHTRSFLRGITLHDIAFNYGKDLLPCCDMKKSQT